MYKIVPRSSYSLVVNSDHVIVKMNLIITQKTEDHLKLVNSFKMNY